MGRATAGYRARVVAINLLILGALLLTAEGAYRVLSPPSDFYRRTFPGRHENGPPLWVRPHERLGWVFSASAGLVLAIFAELARETARRGQTFVVLRYPFKAEILRGADDVSFNFAEFFRDRGILYLDPRQAMRAAGAASYQHFYLQDDAHPAREGNDFVATYIIGTALSR